MPGEGAKEIDAWSYSICLIVIFMLQKLVPMQESAVVFDKTSRSDLGGWEGVIGGKW